jgi:FkbM family methyltransferase
MKALFVIPWLDGLVVHAYPGNEISRAIFLTGCYEPNEFCWLDRILGPGMVLIDVGANFGLYTLFASRKVGNRGTVVAIEPSSREFQRLKANVEANALSNVRLLQVAVSDRRGQAKLTVATEEKSGHNTLGAFGYDSVVPEDKVSVRTERLDDLVQEEGLQRVDVVKMDIEGAELFALRGAAEILARFQPVLLLELSDRTLAQQGCTSEQVWEFLSERRYRIYSFADDTGECVPAQQKHYFDSQNMIAVHELSGDPSIWGHRANR